MYNPYTTTPGKIPPLSFISRPRQIDDIIDEFTEDYPSNQIYKIYGIRGTGKTVVLREIGKVLDSFDNWIIINLNIENDLFGEFYDKLIQKNKFKKFIQNLSFSLNTPLQVTLEHEEKKTITGQIEPLLESARQNGFKILTTIDEVYDKDSLRSFISQYQIWVGEDYPLFLLTAGLNNNYEEIYVHRNMTFFKRAPKKELFFLDLTRVIDDYQEKFSLPESDAEQMALITKGYAYAFQLLGYISWKEKKPYYEILDIFDKEIDNNAYQLIWKELSAGDKSTLISIAKSDDGKISTIRAISGVSPQSFNQSKERLIERKLVQNDEYGKVAFTLPRFKQFVLKAERLY